MKRTLMSLLAKRVHDTPDLVYLKFRKNREPWETITWREYGDRIDRMSRALIGAGIKAGSKVSIIGPASPEWFIIDMSVMTIGATIAPIYFSSSSDQIVYIINHSEAEILFVHEAGYLEKIEHRIISMPSLKKVVVMNGNNPGSLPMTLDLASFERLGDSVPDPLLEDMRDRVNEDDIATYIYTSGTTGPPKAVMLSQKNYYAAGQSVAQWMAFLSQDESITQITNVCFLTLAHVYERTASLTAPLLTGACIYFGNLDNALEELKEIQPHILTALPRTWEKMHEAVMANRAQMHEKRQRVFDWAVNVGRKYNTFLYEKKAIPLGLKIRYGISRKLVISKILDAIGCFDNAKHIMTGGAVSSKEIIDFFFSLGIWICQVYGQTEALGMGSAETRDCLKFGSVGKAFPFSEIDIAEDGEIMVKSDMVSPGYYKEPELTRGTFKTGWLYSGDLGYKDEDGCVFITGRKKDIIITSGAKNITPAKIEASLMSSPLVEHAVVVGDGKNYLTALLTLSLEGIEAYAGAKGVSVQTYEDLLELDGIHEEIETHVKAINQKYSRVEQIKKFTILKRPLSETTGELTSLLKIKRFKVIQNHEAEIERLYDAEKPEKL